MPPVGRICDEKTPEEVIFRRRPSKKGKVQETQFPAGCGQSPQTLRRSAFQQAQRAP